ncbi:MAG: hypothetical protein ACM35H_15820 [Bacteroidota bacterium]|nr:hypothetical protein [Kiloniellaceae bacterium]
MTESAPLRSDPSTFEEVGAAIKREGRELAGEAKSAAQRMARDQRDAVADYASALAGAASRGAEELENAGYGKSAAVVQRAAGEVESLAQQLQQREPEALWGEVEDFTRNHPWMVFGASFALAFGISRFLRSEPEAEATPVGSAEPPAPTGAG